MEGLLGAWDLPMQWLLGLCLAVVALLTAGLARAVLAAGTHGRVPHTRPPRNQSRLRAYWGLAILPIWWLSMLSPAVGSPTVHVALLRMSQSLNALGNVHDCA